MKILVFLLLGVLLAAAPLAAAQEERVLELNMTLDDDMKPVDPCVLSGQCAIGHVYVNLTEPPPQPQQSGITGFFAFESIDIAAFLSEMKGLFNDILEFLKELF